MASKIKEEMRSLIVRLNEQNVNALRKAKRRFQNIIASCGSHDGKVHVYIKPPNPSTGIARNTKVTINSQEQLQKFCERTLEIEAKELIDD